MNKYIASIRVKGQIIKTTVFSDSTTHARLMLEYQFGIGCIVSSPSPTNEALATIKPQKPMNPAQTRIAGLKRQKDAVSQQLKTEREQQKINRAQQQIFKTQH